MERGERDGSILCNYRNDIFNTGSVCQLTQASPDALNGQTWAQCAIKSCSVALCLIPREGRAGGWLGSTACSAELSAWPQTWLLLGESLGERANGQENLAPWRQLVSLTAQPIHHLHFALYAVYNKSVGEAKLRARKRLAPSFQVSWAISAKAPFTTKTIYSAKRSHFQTADEFKDAMATGG